MKLNSYINNNLDLNYTIAKDLFQNANYPWDVIPNITAFIKNLGPTLSSKDFDQVGENIWISKSAKIAPTAFLNGPLVIDENAEIRHCAFIRGSVIIGKNCVVGNSTEVKNSILFDNVQVPHYNYIGDSVLGYKAHMGAGSITSNVKSDKSLVTVKIDDTKIETGLKKFGAILGNHVEVGCNSVLNPGTVIGANSNIYPLSSVRGYVEKNTIYKNGKIVFKIQK